MIHVPGMVSEEREEETEEKGDGFALCVRNGYACPKL